ncbi:MAG: hypothetical protein JRN24_00780 [Nitrososphaerota archaeon]|nr:hypothetical protein [Nitrososphaerota archaeon]
MATNVIAGPSTRIAVLGAFSALIALGTLLSIPLPPPLFEITWAPAVYLALAVLVDRKTAFSATAIGGFLGEAYNVAYRAGGSPIYPFGMIWARAPEVLIVAWAAQRGNKTLARAMAAATIFETLAFFFPDWLFYVYGLFGYGSPTDIVTGFLYASPDFFTMVDLLFIPVAFALIRAARPAFLRLGFVS